jgi:hypothetical protein
VVSDGERLRKKNRVHVLVIDEPWTWSSEQFSLGLVAEDLWNDDTEREREMQGQTREKKKGERKKDKILIDP